MPVDPGHEFSMSPLKSFAVPTPLTCRAGNYPSINNSGFVSDYALAPRKTRVTRPGNYGEILKCFAPEQLPVLNALGTRIRGLR